MEQLKYEIDIFWSEEDGGYIADVPALKYCSAFGETYEEALEEVRIAMDLHLEVLRETGRTIPDPDTALQEGLRTPPKVEAPQTPGQSSEVNEAAQKFTEALEESYRMVTDRAVSAPTLNAELTQSFFNSVIENLRARSRDSEQEAVRAVTQESLNAYMEFVNSMFSFYRQGVETPKEVDKSSR
jgi:predicted RNase H-like HicB family nuclease